MLETRGVSAKHRDRLAAILFHGSTEFTSAAQHLFRVFHERDAEVVDWGWLFATVERPLSCAEHHTATEGDHTGLLQLHRRRESLINRFTQPPPGRIIEVLVVAEGFVVLERHRWPVYVNALSKLVGPAMQRVQFGFGQYRTFHRCDKFSQRADVHANALAAGGERFNHRRATANVRVHDHVAWLGKSLDRRSGEDGGESGGILVIAMRQATHRRSVTCCIDQRGLCLARQVEIGAFARFMHR
ncbi:hypothetical protein XI05_33765 [Bradyrhizobium sp. CCBAU 11357]|nr:hypothetical protein [Bradyrhizobium sp. CCBAU 11357]